MSSCVSDTTEEKGKEKPYFSQIVLHNVYYVLDIFNNIIADLVLLPYFTKEETVAQIGLPDKEYPLKFELHVNNKFLARMCL